MKEHQFWILIGLLCYILAELEKNPILAMCATVAGAILFILGAFLSFTDKNK